MRAATAASIGNQRHMVAEADREASRPPSTDDPQAGAGAPTSPTPAGDETTRLRIPSARRRPARSEEVRGGNGNRDGSSDAEASPSEWNRQLRGAEPILRYPPVGPSVCIRR